MDPEIIAFERRYVARAQAAVAESGSFERIVLDRPDAGLDPKHPALGGWWCRPEGAPGLVVLPSPWDNREAIAHFDRFVWAGVERMTARLGEALNDAHGTELPTRYWDFLLAPWLLVLTAVVTDRRLFCLAASAAAPGVPFVAPPLAPEPAPNFMDSIGGMRSDPWNRVVIGHLARTLGLPVRDEAGSAQLAIPGHRLPVRMSALPRKALGAPMQAAAIAARALLSVAPGRRLALVGFINVSPGQLLRLACKVRGLRTAPMGLRRITLNPAVSATDARHPARIGLASLEADDEIQRAVISLLPGLLPTSVLERYEDVVRESRRIFGPPAHALHGNYSYIELENEFLARCEHAGRRVAYAQHGGAALQLEVASAERFEQRPGSTRITWGGRGGNAVPAPSPYLARLRGSHRGGSSVLVVETLVPPDSYMLRFSTTPLANQAFGAEAMLSGFIESTQATRAQLLLKPFPGATDAGRLPAIAALPRPPEAGTRGATFFMARARLSVVAYPDTPFLEAMVLGGPVLGLWDTALWQMRDDAAPHFEELERVGIVHADPQAAAALVDDVYARANAWWASPEIRAAREAFVERFAMDGDWLAEWSRILKGLTD